VSSAAGRFATPIEPADSRALFAALDPDDDHPGLLGDTSTGTLLLRSVSCYTGTRSRHEHAGV